MFREIGSTSDWAKDLAASAGPGADLHGTVAVALHQTAGRGRLNRAWVSRPGRSLLASVLLKAPEGSPSGFRDAACAMAVALCEAVSETSGVAASVKYPNDVTIGGRKVAGLLLEAAPGHVVAGFGVNVHHRADELPAEVRTVATSIALESPSGVGPLLPVLLEAVLERLQFHLADLDRAANRMAALCDTVGRRISVEGIDGHSLEGLAMGYRPDDGALMLRLDHGMMVPVLSGDIRHLTQVPHSPGTRT